jgi:cysteine desulfuration protein SufE
MDQQIIVNEFKKLSSWEERYQKIIQLGKNLPPLPEEKKVSDYLVRGCQSQVWLYAKKDSNGKIIFTADSDALIVRGLIALLIQIYSGHTAPEILATEPHFITELGFGSNLSPSRANGLMAMIKQMKYYALALG